MARPRATPTRTDATATQRMRFWLRHMKVQRQIENALRSRIKAEFGTTLPRFDVMSALAKYEDGLIMSAISAELKTAAGNVTPIVDRLEAEGLVERRKTPEDGRATRVQLTAAGRAALARQSAAIQDWIYELAEPLTAAQAAQINDLFDAVLARLKEKEGRT
ncbi:MAG: MarR family winged helix-turn-helix transcriptional regulator [Pseudodonghicola sp.]